MIKILYLWSHRTSYMRTKNFCNSSSPRTFRFNFRLEFKSVKSTTALSLWCLDGGIDSEGLRSWAWEKLSVCVNDDKNKIMDVANATVKIWRKVHLSNKEQNATPSMNCFISWQLCELLWQRIFDFCNLFEIENELNLKYEKKVKVWKGIEIFDKIFSHPKFHVCKWWTFLWGQDIRSFSSEKFSIFK